jgi:hypothetical protein
MLFPEVPIIGGIIFKTIPYPPLRPFGGIVFASHIFHRSDKIFRLRSPYYYRILSNPSDYDFLLKILFTDLP